MVLPLKFRGFMAPVFTPFDENDVLNLKEIPKYANYLHSVNVKGVLVNGSVGEGVSMTYKERKAVLATWATATKPTGQQIMVHVGATCLKTVKKLASYAESLGVDSILCMADLFFKPATIFDLIAYLKEVGEAAPNTPLLYYHFPAVTGLTLSMKELLEEIGDHVPSFAGIKFTSNDLAEGAQLLDVKGGKYTIFLGNDLIMTGAIAHGFENFILTYLNFAAEQLFEMYEHTREGRIQRALINQKNVIELANLVMKETSWTAGFKAIISMKTGIQLGLARSPLVNPNLAKMKEIKNRWDKIAHETELTDYV